MKAGFKVGQRFQPVWVEGEEAASAVGGVFAGFKLPGPCECATRQAASLSYLADWRRPRRLPKLTS